MDGIASQDTLLVDDGGGGGVVFSPPNPPENQAPKVNPGINQTITLPTDTVQLDGSNSFDPENGPLSFHWSLENGPTIPAIVNSDKAVATVAGLESGNYGFRLTITDGMGATDTGLIYISVEPGPDTSPAPADDTIRPNTSMPAGGATNTTTAPMLNGQPAPYQSSERPAAGTPTPSHIEKKQIDWLFWGIIALAGGYIIFAKND